MTTAKWYYYETPQVKYFPFLLKELKDAIQDCIEAGQSSFVWNITSELLRCAHYLTKNSSWDGVITNSTVYVFGFPDPVCWRQRTGFLWQSHTIQLNGKTFISSPIELPYLKEFEVLPGIPVNY